MLVLALESSAKSASAAVCNDSELLGQYFQNSKLTHSRTLLSMAESLLGNLDMTVGDIGLFAVAAGPGSFTGTRIGVAAAKGLAWGLDAPVCGVSALEAMAYQVPEPGCVICAVMDARREQVYNALFEWRNGALARLCADRAIPLAELAADSGAYDLPFLLVGDGAALSFDFLVSAGVSCRVAPELLRWQSAYGVALAALHTEPVSAIELEPFYLRPSQAERERRE